MVPSILLSCSSLHCFFALLPAVSAGEWLASAGDDGEKDPKPLCAPCAALLTRRARCCGGLPARPLACHATPPRLIVSVFRFALAISPARPASLCPSSASPSPSSPPPPAAEGVIAVARPKPGFTWLTANLESCLQRLKITCVMMPCLPVALQSTPADGCCGPRAAVAYLSAV